MSKPDSLSYLERAAYWRSKAEATGANGLKTSSLAVAASFERLAGDASSESETMFISRSQPSRGRTAKGTAFTRGLIG